MPKEWPIIGHKRVVVSLKNVILNDKLSHAFLFSGPDKIGKTLVARYFIKSIQCQSKERPCGVCDSCQKIDQNMHSDVMLLQNEDALKIKDVREIKRKLSLRPNSSKYKICLINHSDSLNNEAANALLKILEEPEGKTVLILIADDYEKLLPTIASRCVLYKFSPPPLNEVREYFLSNSDLQINKDNLEELFRKSGGKVGDVFDCLEDKDKLGEKEKIERDFAKVLSESKSDFEKLNFLSNIPVKDRQKTAEILNIWMAYCRELLFIKLGLSKIPTGKINLHNYSLKQIKDNILKINKAKNLLSKNINIKLLIENLLLNLKLT